MTDYTTLSPQDAAKAARAETLKEIQEWADQQYESLELPRFPYTKDARRQATLKDISAQCEKLINEIK